MSKKKPSVFIGSSTKSKPLANALFTHLKEDCEVSIWAYDVFTLSQSTLGTLQDELDKYDFAIFIWSPDDETTVNEKTTPAPRDNVVFETGLFMGAIGTNRVFSVLPTGRDIKVPTDLLGYSNATYDDLNT